MKLALTLLTLTTSSAQAGLLNSHCLPITQNEAGNYVYEQADWELSFPNFKGNTGYDIGGTEMTGFIYKVEHNAGMGEFLTFTPPSPQHGDFLLNVRISSPIRVEGSRKFLATYAYRSTSTPRKMACDLSMTHLMRNL